MAELKVHIWDMVEEADGATESITVDKFERELGQEESVPLDIRDIREVWLEGTIPNAEHAPRGMLECWADPEIEYYKSFFTLDQRYVLYCNKAGWSALAAKRLTEMGYENIAHLDGGFSAWKKENNPIVDILQEDYKNS